MTIERLSQSALNSASQLPFYDGSNGADRRASVAQLAEVLQTLLSLAGGLITQYAAPNASGFGVAIAPPTSGASMWLLLTPLAGYAAGTITLPLQSTCIHGQEVLVSTTQAITTLTVSGNGSTVNGAPTTLAANAFFRLRYDGVLKAFYRIG